MATSKVAKMPPLIYGTAWKQDSTRDLVRQAIWRFRGVDTAAQPKHYREDLVGQGIRDALRENSQIRREELYVQTKFTPVHGQDPMQMPYDPSSSITEQVKASVESSLQNLRHGVDSSSTAYIDCLVLHSPYPSHKQTEEAWRAMESHVPHSVRTLGISNIYNPEALKSLYDFASIKPSVVQNRFYANTNYDVDIRTFCAAKEITYQAFWTLTANPHLLKSRLIADIAESVGVSKPVALYGLVLGLGNVSVLNGTANVERMREDTEGVEKLQTWALRSSEQWRQAQESFASALNNNRET